DAAAKKRKINRNVPFLLPVLLMSSLVAPPPATAQTTAPDGADAIHAALNRVDRDIDAFKRRQFIAFDPKFDLEQAARLPRLRALTAEICSREAAGQDVR